ncbi:MAG: alpha-L-fucosidase [Bacteroidales bacterium]|nr:alpha-L-fucosidase [Candidatus Cryptobacteroides faecihippi]
MNRFKTLLAAAMVLLASGTSFAQTYTPSQGNLDSRKEFVRERFGIFLHWGIYASYGQGEWYLQTGQLNKDEYAKAAGGFYPAAYDASEWVKAFKDAGAEYVTITSRHHDGFSMFKTAESDYNIVDATPFKRDVIKELADACREQDMKLQFYYSILDWIREDFPIGESGRLTGRAGDKPDYDSYFRFMKNQVKELMTQYAPVRALWFDGYWDHKRDSIPFDWRMPEFYEFIHSIDPDCLVGNNHHIAPLPGEDFQMFEKDLPGQNTAGFSEGQAVSDKLPLEMCQTMNHAWGYSVSDRDYKSSETLIQTLARAVSLNTNLLLNIGPQADGRLPQDALDRLKAIGEWMKVNSSAIKGCGPGPLAEQDWGVTTAPVDGGKTFYLHVFKNPGAILEIPVDKKAKVRSVTALDGGESLASRKVGASLFITLPTDIEGADYVIEVTMK